jgi:alkyl hydroperoxide reductase subunit F
MYDVMIIGAGPSGMTAAVYTARKKLNTLLISRDVGGQTNWTNSIENYMGYQFIEGPELIEKFETQVKQFPVDLKIGYGVAAISLLDGGFEVLTESGQTYRGKTVIVASGKRPRPLNVPGEERFKGKGVSYCSTCDAPLFEGMKVAVIGGGNSALEAADDLSRIGEHVYLVSTTPLTADRVLIDKTEGSRNLSVLIEHEILSINGDNFVSGITIKDRKNNEVKELEARGVFVEIGLIPNSHPAKNLTRFNGLGEIEVNCNCETDVPGLFAAGDVTNTPEKQIIIAAGEGAKAALQAYHYLQRLSSP